MNDIMDELAKPGRDPRRVAKVLEFSPDVLTIDDLKEGMVLPGIVTNITNFGAFVDIGIKQDGLIHISQMADKFIANPSEVVKLQQHVKVKVLEVDFKRGRIQLTLRGGLIFFCLWATITPATTIIIPVTFLIFKVSWPSIYAPKADTTGTSEVKIFVRAIPSSVIDVIKRINASPEQSIARYSIG